MLTLPPRLSRNAPTLPKSEKTLETVLRILYGVALLSVIPLVLAQQLSAQPIEPLLETPLVVNDLSPESATLKLITNADLACVVVFGTDTTFGQLALDQTMGASAHREHLVIMRGLKPDTNYVYRLQGSDPQGNFYASTIMRFRTPPAQNTTSLGTNIATLTNGATITAVSSEYSSNFAAQNAIDNNSSTEWSSKGDGNKAFITVTLAEPTKVTGFGLFTRTMGSSAEISQFEVENEAGEVFGPFKLAGANRIYNFPVDTTGQTFTFKVLNSSGGNTGMVELAVYTDFAP